MGRSAMLYRRSLGAIALALTLAACDRLIALAAQAPNLAVHLGFQRRSNPRFREGVERIRRGELGPLIEARASWTS